LKFLDVISNDDPKNVLLSSYIEEMFVDILSKIPYFYMSRFILVCYNQRKLRNLLFKYIQKIVEKLKIVKTNNEPSADLDEENENGFWFFLYAIKLIHKDLPLYLTHYIIEQIAKNDENKHLFLIPSYIEVNSIYEKYPILFPVDNNLIISDYFCENVITINKPQKKDKCFLTYDSIYRIAAIIPFLFVEEIYERALIPLQKKPFTEQLANLRELSRINEKTKINLMNIQTKSKEINSKYCNQGAELKHKCTFIFAVYIYIFNILLK
jgi:hypothetical protein